ncbi:alpha/beta hydrolase [Kribbella sp. NBC_01245]|uniref:alpha/beta hydrolase n=1 Tax=Kribbella sp. NBC_01245 TaxID=2903578 RepID=UPI002E299FA9|nr:alpha/beta hydrolase [Kribbella sp. NBC_01245]
MTPSSRSVTTAPGGEGGPYAPLPMFATDAAIARGAEPNLLWWQDLDTLRALPADEIGAHIAAQIAPHVAGRDPANTLLVGKSLGTSGATVAADNNLPAVWLTPLLTHQWVIDGLRRSTAPFLLVGGTADPFWDSALAHELSPHVLEIANADHGMYVPGRLAASTAVLGQVATAVEDFLDQVVWPA